MTADRDIIAETGQHLNLMATGFAAPGLTPGQLRDRLAQGFDTAAGARELAHRATVARVRASEELSDSPTERHACYPRRVPGTRRVA